MSRHKKLLEYVIKEIAEKNFGLQDSKISFIPRFRRQVRKEFVRRLEKGKHPGGPVAYANSKRNNLVFTSKGIANPTSLGKGYGSPSKRTGTELSRIVAHEIGHRVLETGNEDKVKVFDTLWAPKVQEQMKNLLNNIKPGEGERIFKKIGKLEVLDPAKEWEILKKLERAYVDIYNSQRGKDSKNTLDALINLNKLKAKKMELLKLKSGAQLTEKALEIVNKVYRTTGSVTSKYEAPIRVAKYKNPIELGVISREPRIVRNWDREPADPILSAPDYKARLDAIVPRRKPEHYAEPFSSIPSHPVTTSEPLPTQSLTDYIQEAPPMKTDFLNNPLRKRKKASSILIDRKEKTAIKALTESELFNYVHTNLKPLGADAVHDLAKNLRATGGDPIQRDKLLQNFKRRNRLFGVRLQNINNILERDREVGKLLSKKASLQDVKDYVKSNYEYGSYLAKHKYNIMRAGNELDLPFIQLAVHDYNKLSPKRWDLYRQWFATDRGRNGTRDPQLYKEFRRAADQHLQSVPYGHHWYRNKTPVEKVPLEYRLESLADWYSVYAGNFKGPGKKETFPQWYKKRRDRLPLDPAAKQVADQKLIYKVARLDHTLRAILKSDPAFLKNIKFKREEVNSVSPHSPSSLSFTSTYNTDSNKYIAHKFDAIHSVKNQRSPVPQALHEIGHIQDQAKSLGSRRNLSKIETILTSLAPRVTKQILREETGANLQALKLIKKHSKTPKMDALVYKLKALPWFETYLPTRKSRQDINAKRGLKLLKLL